MDRRTDVMGWLEGLSQDDWMNWHSDSEVQNIAKAALELLKEREPVKPKCTPPKSIYPFECGVCNEPFDRVANYCPNCGRAVKWE